MKILNTKTLVILLAVVLTVFLILEFIGKSERTFREVIVETDTTRLDEFIIIPKGGETELVFTKSGNAWNFTSGAQQYNADQSMVDQIINTMILLKPIRVAASSNAKWKKYEVTDSLASRIQFYESGDLVSDVYIGKFTFTQPPANQQQNPYMQQQQGTMTSFVRLADEDEVYAVEGFLSMLISGEVDHYRNKVLCEVNPENIKQIEFSYPDHNFKLIKENDHWLIGSQPADSLKTKNYLSNFRRLAASAFVEKEKLSTEFESFKVAISGDNMLSLTLNGFPGDSLHTAGISSSLNNEGVLDADRGKLFEKVFVGEEEFLSE